MELVNIGQEAAKVVPTAVEGDGTALREIVYVKTMLDRQSPDDDILKLLHRTLFGSEGTHRQQHTGVFRVN